MQPDCEGHPPLGDAKNILGDSQMAIAADGEKLGDALDDGQDEGLDQIQTRSVSGRAWRIAFALYFCSFFVCCDTPRISASDMEERHDGQAPLPLRIIFTICARDTRLLVKSGGWGLTDLAPGPSPLPRAPWQLAQLEANKLPPPAASAATGEMPVTRAAVPKKSNKNNTVRRIA